MKQSISRFSPAQSKIDDTSDTLPPDKIYEGP
jgi:hypothetical protein